MKKRRILAVATVLFGLLIILRDDTWQQQHEKIQRDMGRYHQDNQSCSPVWSLTNAATGHTYGLMYWSDINYERKLQWREREDRKLGPAEITTVRVGMTTALSDTAPVEPDPARYWIGEVADGEIDEQISALHLTRITESQAAASITR